MVRHRALIALLLVGCATAAKEPVTPTTRPPATRPPPPATRPPPPAPRSALTVEGCAAANPERACRRWELRTHRCAAGVPPGYYDTTYCACDACAADAECAARPGGRCMSFTHADRCPAPRQLCVYPNDPCYPGGRGCPPRQSCFVGDGDAPACQPEPPPAA